MQHRYITKTTIN